mmetsp:Transcript_61054/g.169280  ORF Transcript_61054/g.169280 Transcript_61054/m.169280 type:complete len:202 (+) Transcript_61054:904-1509(+)
MRLSQGRSARRCPAHGGCLGCGTRRRRRGGRPRPRRSRWHGRGPWAAAAPRCLRRCRSTPPRRVPSRRPHCHRRRKACWGPASRARAAPGRSCRPRGKTPSVEPARSTGPRRAPTPAPGLRPAAHGAATPPKRRGAHAAPLRSAGDAGAQGRPRDPGGQSLPNSREVLRIPPAARQLPSPAAPQPWPQCHHQQRRPCHKPA